MLHSTLIGIDKYKDDKIRSLTFAKADAEALGELLSNRVHSSELKLNLLVDKKATRANVMSLIGDELPKNVNTGDLVLLYFACHGSPDYVGDDEGASRYLVMHDTKFDSLFGTGIDMDAEIKRLMQRIDSSVNILCVLDCCFSGRAGGRTFEGARLRKAKAKKRAPKKISLKKLSFGEGRIILTACDDDQVARESFELGHGVFTFHLIQTLTKKRDGETISIFSIYDEVTALVRQSTGDLQVPILNGRSKNMHFPVLH
jgi:uncharacterized caspase-like protein